MRNAIRVFESLSPSHLNNIIPVIEQGLELEKATYLATKDPASRCKISDTCFLLSLLHARQLNINRPGGDVVGDLLN